jgi:hypothetical protein
MVNWVTRQNQGVAERQTRRGSPRLSNGQLRVRLLSES